MSYIVFHNENNGDIHQMLVKTVNGDMLKRIRKYTAEIFCMDVDYQRLLIDVSTVNLLPLPVIANEIRRVVAESETTTASIAIVIDAQEYTQQLSGMIKTILERNTVELFTDIDKAKLWLDLENKRYMKRYH